MLNALDCWMSFCILLLVAGTALYVDPVSKGPHLSSVVTLGLGCHVLAARGAKFNSKIRLPDVFLDPCSYHGDLYQHILDGHHGPSAEWVV